MSTIKVVSVSFNERHEKLLKELQKAEADYKYENTSAMYRDFCKIALAHKKKSKKK